MFGLALAISSKVERMFQLEDLASVLRSRSGGFIQCGYFNEVKMATFKI